MSALSSPDTASTVTDVIDTGPTFTEVEFNGPQAHITYSSADGLHTTDGTPPLAFELAGADKVFPPANARLDAAQVLLTSPNVPTPRFVRYAWRDCPTVNLANASGLPAAPFRIDTD